MARPRKTGLDYFPHDVDATTDPKLEPAIMKYGASAYAFYFVHLEYCYRSSDLSIDVSDTETGTEMRQVIQRKLHINEQEYNNILKTLLRHDAFNAEYYLETGKLTSNGVHKRAKAVLEKRARALEAYESSEKKEKESNKEKEIYNKLNKSKVKETTQETTPEITVSAAETTPETTHKNTKLKEPKQSRSKTFTPPTLEEVKTYCKERDNGVEPNKFYNFYSAKGWMIGKNKMQDWKAAVRTWEQGDNHIKTPSKKDKSYYDIPDDYFLPPLTAEELAESARIKAEIDAKYGIVRKPPPTPEEIEESDRKMEEIAKKYGWKIPQYRID